jgi:hypothetical protein
VREQSFCHSPPELHATWKRHQGAGHSPSAIFGSDSPRNSSRQRESEDIARSFNPSHTNVFGGGHVIAHEILKYSPDLVPQESGHNREDRRIENLARWDRRAESEAWRGSFSPAVFPTSNCSCGSIFRLIPRKTGLGFPGMRNISKLDSTPNRPRRWVSSRPSSNSRLHCEEVQQVSHKQSPSAMPENVRTAPECLCWHRQSPARKIIFARLSVPVTAPYTT